MTKKLEGKTAIVTGSSKGIGAGIAKALAAAGARVTVNYASDKAGADRTVAEITKQGGQAIAVQADVAKPDDIAKIFAASEKAHGKLDILVNNAGIFKFAPLEEVTPELFHSHFNINVLGLLLVSKEALKHFGKNGGSIINTSSVVTTLMMPGSSVYTATKGAVDVITGVLAKELGPRGIRVNAVNPGLIETEGTITAGFAEGDFKKEIETTAPLGRIGKPDDIASVAVFLASDDSKYMTGETLRVAGGMR